MTDLAGNVLDGEFNGTFPSGNGRAGGDFIAFFRINSPPVAQDGILSTFEDTPNTGTLAATDVTGDALSFSIVANGSKGTAVLLNRFTGVYSYTPNLNANGTDFFTFKASDGNADSNAATVTVTIIPANDGPVLDAPAWSFPNPASLSRGATVHVAARDPDGDRLTYAWSHVSGDSAAEFGAPDGADSAVTFSAAGVYVLGVTVTDDQGAGVSAEVRVQVLSPGGIVAWGENYGQCDVPPPNRDFVALAAGFQHSLGLKDDGSIVAWGVNAFGQCTPPSPNDGFVALAAGHSHSLGLKDDGRIVGWGHNGYGQCAAPSPSGGFVALAAGDGHSLGLKSDGSIVAWGRNDRGQCDVPSPNRDFIALAAGNAGGSHSLGLKRDGSIVAWGYNANGQCDVPDPNSDFVALAANGGYSLGLKTDGSLVRWGDDGALQRLPNPNSGFMAIAAGLDHSLGLKSDGSLVAWGSNLSGQCTAPSPNRDFMALAAGWAHSLGLRRNQSPVMDSPARADPNPVTLPATTTVHVVAHDPDGHALSFTWSRIEGPGTVGFEPNGAEHSDRTSASFSAAGDYTLRVTVSDGEGGAATSDVAVTVKPLPGDLNSDGVVNVFDLQIVIVSFGKATADPACDVRADANADGVVNVLDLHIVISHFGASVLK